MLFPFDLNQAWLKRHPDDLGAQANFAEAAFTLGRFAETEQRLATLVDDPKLKPERVALRTLEICSLVALNRSDTLQAKLGALGDLLEGTSDELAAGWTWTFTGSRHFIGQHPKLSRHPWLIRLLAAVEAKRDRCTRRGWRRAGRQRSRSVGSVRARLSITPHTVPPASSVLPDR